MYHYCSYAQSVKQISDTNKSDKQIDDSLFTDVWYLRLMGCLVRRLAIPPELMMMIMNIGQLIEEIQFKLKYRPEHVYPSFD